MAHEESVNKIEHPQKRQPTIWIRLLVVVVLLIVLVGGFLVIRSRISAPGNTFTTLPSAPKAWCAAPSQPPGSFRSISGLAPNDIWVAGSQVMHWNGSQWHTAFSSGSQQDTFNSIVEISPSNIWAAGVHYPTSNHFLSQTLMMHWDGVSWSTVSSPNVAANGANMLAAFSVLSARDIWVIGNAFSQVGPTTVNYLPLVAHWNGQNWSLIPHPQATSHTQLASIKAFNDNDIWITGADIDNTQSFVQHWNGTRWQTSATPDLSDLGGGFLNGIDGSSDHDLWAVGGYNDGMLIEHWDGIKWSLVSSPTIAQNATNTLKSLAVISSTDIWVVGNVGNTPIVEHWNGHQWQIAPNHVVSSNGLHTVMLIGHQPWAVGASSDQAASSLVETLCP